jgi:nitroreductase
MNKLFKKDDNMDIENVIKNRKSILTFDERSVADTDIESLIDAAHWAPSSFNRQPWRFIIATKQQTAVHVKMLDLLTDSNQSWAHRAPLLVLTVAETYMNDRAAANPYAWHDTGMATANLYTMAIAMGLSVHIMGGFDVKMAINSFAIPAGFEPVAVIAIGYMGSVDVLTEQQKERERQPRVRKDLNEIILNDWKSL